MTKRLQVLSTMRSCGDPAARPAATADHRRVGPPSPPRRCGGRRPARHGVEARRDPRRLPTRPWPPAPEIDQLLDEIERGYLRDGPAPGSFDSNIPMYLVGAAHPNKEAARRALEERSPAASRSCTDAEVLQEILHRYTAIRRPERDAIDPAFDALLAIVDVVLSPIEHTDVERARRLLRTTRTRLSARDALHVAIMQGRDIDRILSRGPIQEILHRYTGHPAATGDRPRLRRPPRRRRVVYPFERADVERARRLLRTTPTLSARDATRWR